MNTNTNCSSSPPNLSNNNQLQYKANLPWDSTFHSVPFIFYTLQTHLEIVLLILLPPYFVECLLCSPPLFIFRFQPLQHERDGNMRGLLQTINHLRCFISIYSETEIPKTFRLTYRTGDLRSLHHLKECMPPMGQTWNSGNSKNILQIWKTFEQSIS